MTIPTHSEAVDFVQYVLQTMVRSGTLDKAQAQAIADLETREEATGRKEDAKTRVDSLPDNDNERKIIEEILSATRGAMLDVVANQPSVAEPALRVITGSPGAGKTHLITTLLSSGVPEIYICGDVVKRQFQKTLSDCAAAPPGIKDRYADAVYIHRLTSPVGWEMLDKCLAERKSVILEMLGMDPAADARSILHACSIGYRVEMLHVHSGALQSVQNAIRRYFTPTTVDTGRYISLTNIVVKHSKVWKSFLNTIRLLGDVDVTVQILDNTNLKMVPRRYENTRSLNQSPSSIDELLVREPEPVS